MSEVLHTLQERLMKWIAIAAGVVAVLVVLVLLIGTTLPQSHVATRSVRVRRSPSDVWATVTNVATAATWRKDITRVDMLPPRDGRMVWREVSSHGEVNYEADAARPPVAGVPGRFVTHITGRNLPYGGAWTIEVAADGDGTRVTVTERGEVYNPLFRFVSRFVIGHAATIDGYLRALGQQSGEAVAPMDAAPLSATTPAGAG